MDNPIELRLTISSISPDLNRDVEAILERAMNELKSTLGLDLSICSELVSELPTHFDSKAAAKEHIEEVGVPFGGAYIDFESHGEVLIDGRVDGKTLDAIAFVMRSSQ